MFKVFSPYEFDFNPFKSIGKDWMLITAKKGDEINTMTASWGGVGIMWNKPVAFVFVRPTRYTYSFIEQSDTFSLNFLDGSFKEALSYCGTVSGRDEDKIKKCGFTVSGKDAVPYFEEANTVVLLKKLYGQMLNAESFCDLEYGKAQYADKNYHKLYIAEITGLLAKEE